MIRKTLREQVFKLLFRVEFHENSEMESQKEYFFSGNDLTYLEEDKAEISEKLDNILTVLPEIDEMIEKASEGWELSRIGKVEKTVLRLGLYEHKYDDSIPEGVAINEAVELAKKFGPDNAAAFVNAVLSKFTEAGAKKAAQADKVEKAFKPNRKGDAEVFIVNGSKKMKD